MPTGLINFYVNILPCFRVKNLFILISVFTTAFGTSDCTVKCWSTGVYLLWKKTCVTGQSLYIGCCGDLIPIRDQFRLLDQIKLCFFSMLVKYYLILLCFSWQHTMRTNIWRPSLGLKIGA
jgi:hypothetical protein